MERYNPTEYLLKIQKIKYSNASIAIILILAGFAINFIYPLSFVKYLSLLGLIFYIIISLKYHIKKNIPPEEENIVLSPIYGFIKEIDHESNIIVIKKRIFSPADFRCGTDDENIQFEIESGELTTFEDHSKIPGKLIGILPLSALIICRLTNDYEILIQENRKVASGETVIARKMV